MSGETPHLPATDLLAFVRDRAAALDFDGVRVCDVTAPWQAEAHLKDFLDQGFHGEMQWMENPRRRHPNAVWPEARSAIVVGLSYAPPENPLPELAMRSHGYISVYARNADYHEVLKKRLKKLARDIAKASAAEVKVFVDTAPLMEKPLAEKAGLGWTGKHTNLVSRRDGSWLFLGVILSAAALPPDPLEADHCGTCRACLDICPTKAFPEPYRLDARRCISYLTIEHKGPIPEEFRADIGNRIYGCDDCLAVCPWNKFARTAQETAFHHHADRIAPPLAHLCAMDDAEFRAAFAKSPLKRIGRDRFVRNVLIAIGNSDDATLVASCEARLTDRSALVRGAAVWAFSRLDPERFAQSRDTALSIETDADVRTEWMRLAG